MHIGPPVGRAGPPGRSRPQVRHTRLMHRRAYSKPIAYTRASPVARPSASPRHTHGISHPHVQTNNTHAATGRIYDIHTHIVPSLIRSKQHKQQKRQPTDWWPVRSLWPITSPALAGLAEAALHAGLSKISLSRPLRLAPGANRSDAVRAGARRRHVALGRRLLPARGGAKAPLWHRGVL